MTKFKRLKIRNFKSIKEINFNFEQLNILIGMNGAGKSTLLQALDFISQIMKGNITTWLESREWKSADLNCKLLKESNIDIEVEIELKSRETLFWQASFNRSNLKCTTERISIDEKDAYQIKSKGELHIPAYKKSGNDEINILKYQTVVDYEGSLLSKLKLVPSTFNFVFNEQLVEFREFLQNIKSLELLAPNLMRKSTRTNEDNHVGIGGEKLSSYLFKLDDDQKANLLSFLKSIYPNTSSFTVKNQNSGWKKLIISETNSSNTIEHQARHINDGLLRILAILAQLESLPSFLMLDEIENGINQEIIEKLVKIILSSRTQLLITTHSALVLNYLPDDIAIKSINFVYRSIDGSTHCKRIFDIPHIKHKLDIMGVGDAVLDTNLIELTNSLNSKN